MPAQPTLDVAVFDRRCVELHLSRLVPCRRSPEHPSGYRWVPNNTKIAKHLHVSQSTVSRARAGMPMSASFVALAVERLGLSYSTLFPTFTLTEGSTS